MLFCVAMNQMCLVCCVVWNLLGRVSIGWLSIKSEKAKSETHLVWYFFVIYAGGNHHTVAVSL